jgi:hypothetical protein
LEILGFWIGCEVWAIGDDDEQNDFRATLDWHHFKSNYA